MKNILPIVLTLALLTGCGNSINRFYNGKVLKEFDITDFPHPQGVKDENAPSSSTLYFNTTKEGFEKYAEELYTYLVGKNFTYFGYRGNELSNAFGGAPEYEFYISSNLSDHKYLVDRFGNKFENCYVFVFADELSEDSLINECAIELIYRSEDEYNTHLCVYYDKNVITSYTLISNK
ncbi:MAG: hypothetical protein ACI311_04515 [Bacilli bacterium]